LFSQLAARIASGPASPFDFIVVDEAQDVGVSQLRFLAALGKNRPDALFFAGDLGQRIFRPPFSWKALGVDIRGRSTTLKINYRTSHQIRTQADRLLGSTLNDVDGNSEDRKGTTSVFNGPLPVIEAFDSQEAENAAVSRWLSNCSTSDRSQSDHLKDDTQMQPHEIGVFVRSSAELARAQEAVAESGLKVKILNENVDVAFGSVSVGTMHLAKGLEFRALRLWPVTMKLYHRKHASKTRRTIRIWKKSTTLNGICCMSHARAPETTCWYRA
jgi:superfamily I DNA/RNA helicase